MREPRSLALETRIAFRGWMRAARRGGMPLRNFGDELSRTVVAEAFGEDVAWAPPSRAKLFAVGSILERAIVGRESCTVWGSGLRSHNALEARMTHIDRSTHFAAVRGVLTREQLGLPLNTPLGDPALLVRSLFPHIQGGNGTVLLPHYRAFNDPDAYGLIQRAEHLGWTVLSPTDSLGKIVSVINAASIVFSSSLHGKIVADALGTPAVLVHFGHRTEDDYKYDDYLSVWGYRAEFIDVREALDGNPRTAKDSATRQRDIIDSKIDSVVDRLRESAATARADVIGERTMRR